ncbi:hypothetical protein TRFO_10688 [Tritrichomonas foetus]|uniref:Uncharacterized protein n=1 Tax=Tritrichomonas foetus TaxID=1144522 RepID=A0A1J4JC59_9EUKA|nr:hypothetical protein TRFO_10688 [Tritrichomonas foetus]|eukprot:OHS94997.1 hypothetical protein TRFO_10688 [Tritrichomonas foetus]
MIEEVVDAILLILQGGNTDALESVTSNQSYKNPCCSIIENFSYTGQIRFNACKILSHIIRKFSLYWTIEEICDLYNWFLSVLSTHPDLLSSHTYLPFGFGSAFASLIYSQYKREPSMNEFVDKIQPIIFEEGQTELHIITCLKVLSGMCDFFQKYQNYAPKSLINEKNPFILMKNICIYLLSPIGHQLSTVNDTPSFNQRIISAVLELLNSIFYVYYSETILQNFDEVAKFTLRFVPRSLMNDIVSPQFLVSYLEFLYFHSDSQIQKNILDLLFKLVSLDNSCFHDHSQIADLYKYVTQILTKIIQQNHSEQNNSEQDYPERSYFGQNGLENEILLQICSIAYKINIGLDKSKIDHIQSYSQFIEAFFQLCISEIYTQCILEDTDLMIYSLLYWNSFYKYIRNLDKKYIDAIINSTNSIAQKVVESLFEVIHQDYNEFFVSLLPQRHNFKILSYLVNIIDDSQINSFAQFLNALFVEKMNHYGQTKSINNEAELCLTIYLCSQYLIKNGKNDYFECEAPIMQNFLNLLNFTKNELNIYTENHSESDSNCDAFLERSILDFLCCFPFMAFGQRNNYHVHEFYLNFFEGETIDTISKLFFERIHLDFSVFSRFSLIQSLCCDCLRALHEQNIVSVIDNFIFIDFPFYSFEIRKIYKKNVFALLLRYHNSLKDIFSKLIQQISNKLEQETTAFNQNEFINVMIDLSSLFHVISDSNQYNLVFDCFFPRYFSFFETFREQIFTNQEITPFSLLFWKSLVRSKGSKIEFKKYSPNGILLLKSTEKILTPFLAYVKQFANDENLANYATCLVRTVTIIGYLVKADYILFDALFIYNDDCFKNLLNAFFQTIMVFELKNIFEFNKFGDKLTICLISFFEKRQSNFLLLDNDIILFIVEALEISYFAPNSKQGKNNVHITISKIIDLFQSLSQHQNDEKASQFLEKATKIFDRLFLQVFHLLFTVFTVPKDLESLFCSLTSLYNGVPEYIVNQVIEKVPVDFQELFMTKLNSFGTDSLSQVLKSINEDAQNKLPSNLWIYDKFPVKWNLPKE